MTHELRYASAVHGRVTRVTFPTEVKARGWFGKCSRWRDVIRIALLGPDGAVLADDRYESRMSRDSHHEIADAMHEPHMLLAPYPFRDEVAPPTSSPAVAPPAQVCRCGDDRVQHAGPSGDGSCAREGCTCKRFWRRT